MKTYVPGWIGTCPFCSGPMYPVGSSAWCPAEDPHPGGVVIYADGLVKKSDLAPRGMVAIPPKNGGAE